MDTTSTTGVRLAELVAALSLATDLGLGHPQQHVLRQTVIATRLATAAGLAEEQRAAVFHVSLLAWTGCIADSHELAQWFDDDRQLRADSYHLDKAGLPLLRFMLGHLAGNGVGRIATLSRFLVAGVRGSTDTFVSHCQTTGDIAGRLDLPEDVRRALPQAFERWDGKGSPAGLRGTAIDPVMRVVQIADDAEVFHRLGGTSAALAMLADRAGTEFDPDLVATCRREASVIFAGLDELDAWGAIIAASPTLDRRLSPAELVTVLETFADYADLKSPWFTGQSRATAGLAAAAAGVAGVSATDVELCRQAGLVARLGVIGVSTRTWDKAAALTGIEWERVRTVPYLTERVLSRQPRLAEVGAVAGMRCERMDGSGYPRGLAGPAIPAPARLLAAADVYEALTRARPHRPAVPPGPREELLRAEVSAGRLDGAAVTAVLTAAGHRTRPRPAAVRGLTDREVQVLGLLARGRSNKEMARQLHISARTVGSHVEHIYAKIEVNTRGAAAMFAMRHGLVGVDDAPFIG